MFTSRSNLFISVPLDFKGLAKGFSQLGPLLVLNRPLSATTVSLTSSSKIHPLEIHFL